MKDLYLAIAFGVLLLGVGCTQRSVTAPTDLVSDSTAPAATASTYEPPVVTLQADLTPNPSQITVRAGYEIMMVNQSGRYRTIRSYNCSEFNMMNVPDGGWQYSSVFRPAGKTCNYFAWDVNWSRKILEGQVTVVP